MVREGLAEAASCGETAWLVDCDCSCDVDEDGVDDEDGPLPCGGGSRAKTPIAGGLIMLE